MIVSVMGNDGAGKTSLVGELRQRCEAAGLEVETRHGYDRAFYGPLLRRFNPGKLTTQRAAYLNTRAPRSVWMRIWPFAVWVEYLLVSWKLLLSNRRRIVLYDRHWADQLLSFEHLGCSSRIVRWLYLRLPRPHVMVLLQAPPALACRRKGEDTRSQLDYHIQQRRRYLELAKRLGLQPIDSRRPCAKIAEEIWQNIQRRRCARHALEMEIQTLSEPPSANGVHRSSQGALR